MTHVGTAGCKTDVFVCISIDDTHFFAARISAYHTSLGPATPWAPSQEAGAILQNLILLKLERLVDKVMDASESFPSDSPARAIILCPTPGVMTQDNEVKRTASSHIIEAIRGFFLAYGTDEPTASNSGCVVNPWDIGSQQMLTTTLLPATPGQHNSSELRIEQPEDYNFRRVWEGMGKEWLFAFDESRPEAYHGWLIWRPN